MKKFVCLVVALMLLMGCYVSPVAAADAKTGFFNIGSAAGVTITPMNGSSTVSATSEDVTEDGTPDTVYYGSDRLKVTYTKAVAEKTYIAWLVKGTAIDLNNVEETIYDARPENADATTIEFMIYPKEISETMDMTLIITSNDDVTEVSIPLSYLAGGGAAVSGTALSWNDTDNAIYMLYADSVSDKDIRDAWQKGTYATLSGVQSYTATKGSISSVTVDKLAMKSQTFSFEGVADGTYKLAIFKPEKYVPKVMEITVSGGALDLGNVKLWLYGDVIYDGKILANDAAQITRKANKLTSVFDSSAADLNDRTAAADVIVTQTVLANDAAQVTRRANKLTSIFDTFK